MKFELYQVKTGAQIGQWRWRLKAANGEPIASGESYVTRNDAIKAVHLVMDTDRNTSFVETNS